MPSGRKSTSTCAFFLPTVPLPPQTILSIETELSYFRHHLPLLLDTELRPFSLRNRAHPYQHPIPRRGVTPDRDCLDWPQYPLTHTVGATLRRSTPPLRARSRSRQPTPTPALPARSRKPTPAARQPTPGPSAEKEITTIPHRAKSVRFPSPDGSGNGGDDGDSSSSNDDDDNEPLDARGGKVATPDADGLISKPDGEVGRLTRGGYSLPATLGWKQARFKSTKELVSSYVENYLSHSFSESNQPQGHVESLQKLVSDALQVSLALSRSHPNYRFWLFTLISWTSIGMVGLSAT